jgi:hypothetical protein
MALRGDIIPTTILDAAKKAGLSKPDWYVGRINGHESQQPKTTLQDIVDEAMAADRSDAAEPKSGQPDGP